MPRKREGEEGKGDGGKEGSQGGRKWTGLQVQLVTGLIHGGKVSTFKSIFKKEINLLNKRGLFSDNNSSRTASTGHPIASPKATSPWKLRG